MRNQAITMFFATVLGAILASIVNVWFQRPSEYAITVDAAWVDVPGTGLIATVKKDVKDALIKIEKAVETKGIVQLFEDTILSSRARVFVVSIRNDDTRRTKNIEVYFDEASAALVSKTIAGNRTIEYLSDVAGKPIPFGSLNPGESASVVAVSGRAYFSYFTELPIKALHDGVSIPITQRTIERAADPLGGAMFVLNFPWVSAVIVIFLTAISIITLFVFVANYVINTRFDWMAKAYNRKDIQKMFAFTEWVRANRPDLLPPGTFAIDANIASERPGER